MNAIILLNVLSFVESLLVAVVPDGNVGTGLRETLSNGQTDTSTSTRDDGGPALEAEEGHQLALLWRGGVVVGEATLVHCLVGHVVCFLGGGMVKVDVVFGPKSMYRFN